MGSLNAAILALCLCGGSDTVLLDFYGDYCPPCRAMQPVLQQLEARGYPIRKINVQREANLASRFGVRSIPCFVMLVDGREVDRVVGSTSAGRLEQMLAMGGKGRPSAQPPVALASGGVGGPRSVPIPAEISKTTFAANPPPAQLRGDVPAAPIVLTSGQTAPPNAPREDRLEGDLIACTVRLRIEDANGNSCGSGTIVDARGGEALVLTCGHLFRDSRGAGRIEVDLFGPNAAERIPGQLVHYDLEKDLGLIKIRTPGPVYVARVAPPGYPIAKGARVISVGCNNGDIPTVRHAQVTALDKFLGPSNVEVSGLPVQGRSGGGLFSADGQVIGVCNAAVPTDNEGLYAALASIHAELDQAQVAFVYRDGQTVASGDTRPTAASSDARQAPGSEPPATAGQASATVQPPSMAKQMPPPSNLLQLTDAPGQPASPPAVAEPASQPQVLTPDEKAALEEIHKRKAEGAELICIVRSHTDPHARSEVIVLDRVSPAFLKQLTTDPHQQPMRASLPPGEPSHAKPWPDAPAGQASPSARPGDPPDQSIDARPSPAATTDWQPRWLAQGYQGS